MPRRKKNTNSPDRPSPGFTDLSPDIRLSLAVLHARLSDLPRGVPKYFFLAVTSRCQLACAHCRYRQRGAGLSHEDITPATATRIFAAAAKTGIPRVILFGGEPTLHPRLPLLVSLASAAGLFTELDTNGLELRREGALASLRRAGLCAVRISVHSSSPSAHDALAGKGTFAGAVASLRAARRSGLLSYISSCAFSGGAGPAGAAALAAFARAQGAHGLRVLPYAGPGAGPDLPLRLSTALARIKPAGYARSCVPPGEIRCAALSGESVYVDQLGAAWSCPYSDERLGAVGSRGFPRPPRRRGRVSRFPCAENAS